VVVHRIPLSRSEYIHTFFCHYCCHYCSDQHLVDRQVVLVDPISNKKLVRNEGFFRAEVSERGLQCNHPDAECGRSASAGKNKNSNGNGKACGGHCGGVGNHFPWYDIPFGVMVPAHRHQASNLLVPVCLSASSVAYSSARIENMFMDLGSAAGVAVAHLLDQQSPSGSAVGSCPFKAVQDTNVSAVQDVLSNVYQQKFHGPTTTTVLEE
jgi:hypothetical protein